MSQSSGQIGLAVVMVLALSFVAGGLGGFFSAIFVNEPTTIAGADAYFEFEPLLTGFVGKSTNIKNLVNPDLKVDLYATITVKLRAVELMAHNFYVDEFGVASEDVSTSSQFGKSEVTVSFRTTIEGIFEYYCAIPGHRITMSGRLIVGNALANQIGEKKNSTVDSIIHHPLIGPTNGPVGARAATNISFTIVTKEVVAEIEPGTSFEYWTFNGTVPGPLLRVRVGDNVSVTLINDASSKHTHSIDLHAATDAGGGAAFTQVAPGNSSTFTFTASHEGVFIYHCASPHVPTHMALGLFGAISVEPATGLPTVEKEFYIGQSEIYTKWKLGTAGHQEFDDKKLYNEEPTYVVFNGAAFGLTNPAYALNATLNDRIRIFFAVGGPNVASNFHLIGEVWDKVWYETSASTPNIVDAETIIVAPGAAIVIELLLEKYIQKDGVIRPFILVDHALSRAFDKGCIGYLYVNLP